VTGGRLCLPCRPRAQLSLYSVTDYDYELPPERIAQTPLDDRGASRLLTLDRESGGIGHRVFRDLPDLLRPTDLLVLNDTRVSAQRLFGARPGHDSERVEVFLIAPVGEDRWSALVRPGKKLLPGTEVTFDEGLRATVEDRLDDRGGRIVRFHADGQESVADRIARIGAVPLPPYITTPLAPERRERYQTVYNRAPGSAAAPTAGLHFTPDILERLRLKGVRICTVTLHVGIGTFRPISTSAIDDHVMHAERYEISAETAQAIERHEGRIVAVGTTCVRTLESAAVGDRRVAAGAAETDLFIKPGYRFRIVDALITNFHLPRTTLLVLVSAFAGREKIQAAYAEALAGGYRFLSFGDAMFIS